MAVSNTRDDPLFPDTLEEESGTGRLVPREQNARKTLSEALNPKKRLAKGSLVVPNLASETREWKLGEMQKNIGYVQRGSGNKESRMGFTFLGHPPCLSSHTHISL